MPKSSASRRLDAKSRATQKTSTAQSIRTGNMKSVRSGMSMTNAHTDEGNRGLGVWGGVRGGRAVKKQDLFMAACIALGCWGFAFSFIFTTTDPNRYTYGALAAMLALMWSVLFAMRLRKWLQQG